MQRRPLSKCMFSVNVMKTPFWTLLLLSLCSLGHSDCQGDCLTCGLLLPEQQAFNTLLCILECESQASPALTWDLCYQAVGLNQLPLALQEETSKRSDNELQPVATVSIENDNGVEFTEALERFRHAAQALRSQQASEEVETPQKLALSYDPGTEVEQDGLDADEEKSNDAGLNLSKRFGGFIKGRHGFKKLVSSGRPLQKRYGGFIGIRKSARKWNNQKRVSQLLRQYLSLTGRSGRSGYISNISARIRRQNDM
ncbi:prepronociceptin b isoform X1 [Triplophysa dalaica]|uniref:prepronociceptin b isoform X1 n=2 Tax=Triplophysa dalaica TaxID=1582913 RepID=UPI0024DF57DD|nr:prepronociceptin b isoform X1 [Triplophysa dalaica]